MPINKGHHPNDNEMISPTPSPTDGRFGPFQLLGTIDNHSKR